MGLQSTVKPIISHGNYVTKAPHSAHQRCQSPAKPSAFESRDTVPQGGVPKAATFPLTQVWDRALEGPQAQKLMAVVTCIHSVTGSEIQVL